MLFLVVCTFKVREAFKYIVYIYKYNVYLYFFGGSKVAAAVRAIVSHKKIAYAWIPKATSYVGCSLQLVLKLNNKAKT